MWLGMSVSVMSRQPIHPSRSPTTTITTNGDTAKPPLHINSAVAQGWSRREVAAGEAWDMCVSSL